jgi:hypothetical protein
LFTNLSEPTEEGIVKSFDRLGSHATVHLAREERTMFTLRRRGTWSAIATSVTMRVSTSRRPRHGRASKPRRNRMGDADLPARVNAKNLSTVKRIALGE